MGVNENELMLGTPQWGVVMMAMVGPIHSFGASHIKDCYIFNNESIFKMQI